MRKFQLNMMKRYYDEIIEKYLYDESRIIKGFADELIIVEDEHEIVEVINEAISKSKRITISGAGTGITGSRVPLGGIIVSMEEFSEVRAKASKNEELIKTNEFGRTYSIIIGVDEKGEYYAKAPPGIPLYVFKRMVESKGLFYPPDPTEESSLLGGNVATNASGSRTFKYGSTRDYVKRLRIVLPIVEVIEIRRGENLAKDKEFKLKLSKGELSIKLPNYEIPKVEKNAAGYFISDDLIDLFIGSEGTLGVISEIEVRLIKKPNRITPIFAYFKEEYNAVRFSKLMRKKAREEELNVIAVEFFDENSLDFLRERYSEQIPANAKAIIDLEIESKNEDEEMKQLEMLNELLSSFDAEASIIEEAKKIRHALPAGVNEFLRLHGTRKIATDIAVPESGFEEMYKYYHQVGKSSGIKYVLFGHIGNFHLHFNFLPRNDDEQRIAEKNVLKLLKKAVELGGTISAEHGVGKKYYIEGGIRKPLISLLYSEEVLLQMARLKKTFDPHLILNIGNIIPEEYLRTA